jgi:predicted O-linked N-acetylglucosamine transferase (SPINDLY family)
MRILRKVKNSVILFVEFNSYAKENLKKEALKRNINPNRLIFSPLIDFDKRLLRYKFCDLFLDTFPYTAHSTASECLWSETPLLTLAGESFQSRVSFSLLKNLEMDELITYSIEEYEKKAIDIGSNKLLLKQIKDKLGQSIKKTSIFNMTNYVKNLETGYLEIFKRKKEERDPDDIYIN